MPTTLNRPESTEFLQDYLTEVHHINGEGLDAGVVYSEMQVRKNVIKKSEIVH